MIEVDGAVLLRGFCDAIEDHVITRALSGLVERATANFQEEDDWLYFSARASSPEGDIDGYVFEGENIIVADYENNPVILFSHDREAGIGLVDKLSRDAAGMRIERGKIDLTDPFAAEKANHMRRGILRGVSMAVRPLEDPKYKEGRLYFGKVQLFENSMTYVPANVRSLIGKEARDLWAAAAGGSRSANHDLTETVVKEIIARERSGMDAHMDARQAEFDRHVSEQIRAIDLRAAEAVERRVGSVASLLERVERPVDLAESLRAVIRYNPVVQAPPPGGGGGGPTSPPSQPPALGFPAAMPGAGPVGDGSESIGATTGQARPLAGDLVPAATAPDAWDGHTHKILVLREDGSGATEVIGGPDYMQHMHPISNWQVVTINVGGRESAHPGSLQPGMALAAGPMVDRTLDQLWHSIIDATPVFE